LRGLRCSLCSRPRFRREVRRFTTSPPTSSAGRTERRAPERARAGARPGPTPTGIPDLQMISRLVASTPSSAARDSTSRKFELFTACGFRVTVDYSLHRNTRIILSHSVAVRFALVRYCCARSSCSAGAQGASPRTAVRTAHALLAEWRAAFQGRPSLT
jgi:hypothetical protein